MRHFILTFIFIIFGAVSVSHAAKKDMSDHPLVRPYEGSVIYSKDIKQYDEYRIFKGWDKDAKEHVTDTLEGKVTKILYTNPPERSVLEMYRNYESALKAEGVEVLYECNQKNMECMSGYVGANLRREFQLSSIGNSSGRYMVAKLEQDEQTAYLMLGVGEKYTDVHIVEIKKMETGKASLNLSMLTDDLDKQGFVIVEGIYFDTDKTTLKPESMTAINIVAQMLEARPDLELYVVGHTDMQGSLAHNMTLSQGRAKSVVSELVSNKGIAPERLQAKGVGSLSPMATNNQESGRAKNRRVVLVQR